MGRDLVTRPYGRFFHLPLYLAQRGHEVYLLLLDYTRGNVLESQVQALHMISEPLRTGSPHGYISRLKKMIHDIRPDWLIGCSDTYFGIIAQHYAHRHGIRYCIDAYDNYESYIPWLKPLHGLWRRSLAGADLVSAAGPELLELMMRDRPGKPGIVVPMAADSDYFRPMNRQECRRQMGLPENARLIGYCGSLHRNRGLEVLFEAAEMLDRRNPDVKLVLSGRRSVNMALPDKVFSLGYIEDERMPLLLNSLDVLAVINRMSSFGKYSYPVKLYEAMRINLPVAVTRTPATEWIMRHTPESLVPAADAGALSHRLEECLEAGEVVYPESNDWFSSGACLEQALLGFEQG